MNYIDMFILVLLIWAIFRGYTRGFIMQIAILAALTIGVFAALKLSGFTVRQLETYLNVNPESLYLISVGITFLLVFFGIYTLGKFVENMVETVQLSMVNRLFGVFFAVAKVILITGIILAFVDRLDHRIQFLPKNSREHSLFFKPFTTVAKTIFPSLELPEAGYSGTKELVIMLRK